MIAADRPSQRPPTRRLLVVDARRARSRTRRARRSPSSCAPGDLVVANDAATLPASLHGVHVRDAARRSKCGSPARRSLAPDDVARLRRRRLRRRRLPHAHRGPAAAAAARSRAIAARSARSRATVERCSATRGSSSLRFDGDADAIWAGIARHGRPIQYAHVPAPLALWDVWTPIAGPPVAFEPPSAGFALDWRLLARAARARRRRSPRSRTPPASRRPATPTLDARLPFDEPYASRRRRRAAIAARAARGRPRRRGRHDRRARARARGGARRRGARGRRRRRPAHRPGHAAARRRRDPLRHARAGHAATTSCCARSRDDATLRARERGARARTATARTSSATPSSSKGRAMPSRESSRRIERCEDWSNVELVATLDETDPRPQPPARPHAMDCCGGGCCPCVFDLYEQELERYQAALGEWSRRHPEG